MFLIYASNCVLDCLQSRAKVARRFLKSTLPCLAVRTVRRRTGIFNRIPRSIVSFRRNPVDGTSDRVEGFLKDLKPPALSALTADRITDDSRGMSARCDLPELQRRRIDDGSHLVLVDLVQVPQGNRSICTIGGMDRRTVGRVPPR